MSAELVGWALVHSIWEGALVAGVAGALTGSAHHLSSNARYLVNLAALALMLIAPVATATWLADGGGALAEAGRVVVRTDTAMPWLVAAWLLGVSVMSVRLVAGFVRTRKLVRDGTSPVDARIGRLVSTLAHRLDMAGAGAIEVLQASRVHVPLVVGWVRPILLLPASLFTGLTAQELELILVHELAHIRRHDYLVNVFQAVAETLLFYHPAAWWLSKRIRDEREHCCDDIAVATCGVSARDYAAALLAMEESRGGALVFSIAATGGSLLRRVERLTGTERRRDESGQLGLERWVVAVAAVVVLSVGLGRGDASIGSRATVGGPPSVAREDAGRVDGRRAPAAPTPASTRGNPVAFVATSMGVDGGGIDERPGLRERNESLDARWRDALERAKSSRGDDVWIQYTSEANLPILIGIDSTTTGGHALARIRTGSVSLQGERERHRLIWIGTAGTIESVALLRRLLDSASVDGVRTAIVDVIGAHHGDAVVVPVLADLALEEERSADERIAAAKRIGGRAGLPALTALVQIARSEGTSGVQKVAIEALARVDLEPVSDTLIAMSSDLARMDLRGVAVWSLGQRREPRVVDALRRLASADTAWSLRAQVLASLSRIEHPSAVTALESIADPLGGGPVELRISAVDALGRARSMEPAIAALRRIALEQVDEWDELSDCGPDTPDARRAAVEALGRMAPARAALRALTDVVWQSSRGEQQLRAVDQLRHFGNDRETRSLLERMSRNHQSSDVRAAAARLLQKGTT